MLITIKEYCNKRNVSRQYVYQEIKRGKFKTVELPVFVRHQGSEQSIGVQKFLELPTSHIDIDDDNEYALILASLATSDDEIKKDLIAFLSAKGDEKRAIIAFMNNKYDKLSNKHLIYEEARQKLVQLWLDEVKQISKDVKELKQV